MTRQRQGRKKGRSILMKTIITRLNTYFLHDEDETAPISDYIWFYGFMLGAPTLTISVLLLTW